MYNLNIVQHVSNNYETLKKYNDKKDPITNICHVEMSPFDLKVKGE